MLSIGTKECNGDLSLLRLLRPCRRQRLRTDGLTRCIPRFDSCAISLLVSVIVPLGHCYRLMAGEVVDLIAQFLDGSVDIFKAGLIIGAMVNTYKTKKLLDDF